MKTIFLYILIGLTTSLSLAAQSAAIKVGDDGKSWEITTRSSGYRLEISSSGMVNAMYYGNRLNLERPGRATVAEIPVRGGYVSATPMLEAVFPDHVRDIELEYKASEITAIDGYPVLKIVQSDKYYPLEVTSYIRALPEYDMIEKWVTVANTGKKGAIRIENLLSGSVSLPKDAYELTHYSGVWGYEFVPQTTKLTQGTKTIQVKDFKSYGSSSFMVRPEGENDKYAGKVWFGSLSYSGNWRIDFDKSFSGNVQIVGGINFWDQEVNLKPGQSLTTPRILFGYTGQGAEGVTMSLASYSR